jgi:hypothetical protein
MLPKVRAAVRAQGGVTGRHRIHDVLAFWAEAPIRRSPNPCPVAVSRSVSARISPECSNERSPNPGAGQPGLHGAFRDPEHLRGRGGGQFLDQAKLDHVALFSRQVSHRCGQRTVQSGRLVRCGGDMSGIIAAALDLCGVQPIDRKMVAAQRTIGVPHDVAGNG